ncbi:unnamed protein product [Ectocarpus sp. 6 AP-2014]
MRKWVGALLSKLLSLCRACNLRQQQLFSSRFHESMPWKTIARVRHCGRCVSPIFCQLLPVEHASSHISVHLMEDCTCPDSGCAWRPESRRVAFEYLFRLVCILRFTRHVGVVTAVVLSALLCLPLACPCFRVPRALHYLVLDG